MYVPTHYCFFPNRITELMDLVCVFIYGVYHTRPYTGPSVMFVVYSLKAAGSAAPAVENSVRFPRDQRAFCLIL